MMNRLALALLTALLVVPRLSAETHRFTPTVYYNTYSFAHPPALRIKPGDRVVTKTIDASGADAAGKSVASFPIRRPARFTSRAPSPATCSS